MRWLAVVAALAAGCGSEVAGTDMAVDDLAAAPDLNAGLPRLLFTSDSASWVAGAVSPGMPTLRFYDVGVDSSVTYAGMPTGNIHYLGPGDGGGTPYMGVTVKVGGEPVKQYAGKRVRMSIFVKTDAVLRGAAPWLRIDDATGPVLLANGFEPGRALTGTQDFTEYTHVVIIPDGALTALFGMLLDQDGSVWSGVARFEEVDDTVALTPVSL